MLFNLFKISVGLPWVMAFIIGSTVVPTKISTENSTKTDSIVRKKLLLATFPIRQVSGVDIREISFKPLQQTGRHLHPIPVTGYIVSGTILFQIKGQNSKVLHAGEAFFEPANATIAHFDNTSRNAGAKFVAFYFLGDKNNDPLIKMLP